MGLEIRCVVDSRCVLGEGPVWDARTASLYWVDIKGQAIYRLDAAGQVERWPAPEPVGALALREKGGLLLALKSGLAFFEPGCGPPVPIAAPEAHIPGNRMNDGKCDPLGRFWVGTMDEGEVQPSGHLYRLNPDLSLRRFEVGFVVTNGMDWSGDGRTLYFTDSVGGVIYAYGFDMAAGRPGAARVFAAAPKADGSPDGLCVDAEDHVWSAHWGGARLTRYRPDGTVERVLALPAPLITSCCFGGRNLDTLYVTSARVGLSAAELEAAPLSGGVMAITGLGVRGRPMARFAG